MIEQEKCAAWCHAARWEGFRVRCAIDFQLREPGTEHDLCELGRDPTDPAVKEGRTHEGR